MHSVANSKAFVCAIACTLTIAFGAQAQNATLTARGNHEYRSITDVRELSAGRLLISDTEAGTVWLLQPNGTRSNAIKSGNIQAPGRFRALAGDSTIVFSRADTRFMVITPDGSLVSAPASLTPPQGPFRIGTSSDLYATNGRGELFWSDVVRGAESMPLQRRTSDGAISSIASLRTAPSRMSGEGGITYTVSVPFSPVDDWDIADNGDVVLARGEPYRIDRITADGTTITGKVREYNAVPLTAADREQVTKDRQRSMGSINLRGTAISIQVPDDAWPKTKPAFGRFALRAAPDGSVWAKRHVPANATFTQYDVFNKDGSFRDAVTLPPRAEVVGFGKGMVFVSVRTGSDGPFALQALSRP